MFYITFMTNSAVLRAGAHCWPGVTANPHNELKGEFPESLKKHKKLTHFQRQQTHQVVSSVR